MKRDINKIFNKIYGYQAEKSYFSPGRVNIIGGHTDYNGGAVLPFCIDAGIYACVSERNDSQVNVYSDNLSYKGVISFELDDVEYKQQRNFANYASGVMKELTKRGYVIQHGFDIAMVGNLPRGGGLSSSAALLVLITKIVNDYNHFNISGKDMAIYTKAVENNYIGVSSGIMDQFIIANGKKDNAIYLNANTLAYDYVPVDTTNYKIVLINSNQTRKLTESKYNVRQRETQDALKIFKTKFDIEHLCDLSPEVYEANSDLLQDQTLQKRVKHVVYENQRVKEAKVALENKDFKTLGKLLDLAHNSARDLYEISSDVLDDLVVLAKQAGSIGSKMIGGGFGGSTLNLVPSEKLEEFLKNFSNAYKNKYHKEPVINLFEPTSGVREI